MNEYGTHKTAGQNAIKLFFKQQSYRLPYSKSTVACSGEDNGCNFFVNENSFNFWIYWNNDAFHLSTRSPSVCKYRYFSEIKNRCEVAPANIALIISALFDRRCIRISKWVLEIDFPSNYSVNKNAKLNKFEIWMCEFGNIKSIQVFASHVSLHVSLAEFIIIILLW